MKDLADATVCVVDSGIYMPVALRLARDFKKVYYHIPGTEAFPTLAQGSRGSGFDKVEMLDDDQFRLRKKEMHAFIFPDASMGGFQLELQDQGFPVWGSKLVSHLEQKRGLWLDKCDELGLPMPKTERIKGIDAAWEFFKQNQGEIFWVKVSKWRGDMETWKAVELNQISNKLDLLRLKWGPMAKEMMFYIQHDLKTDIEGGADTYFAGGGFPDRIILGYEKKGESYLAVVKKRSEMPPEIWEPMQKIVPTLAQGDYCNMVSSEIRVADGKSYWLDPCFRFPSPAGEEEIEIYKNFSEIIWGGANGQLVQPEIDEEFCGEAVISYCGDREGWKSIVVPKEVEQWVKLYACVYYDGAYHFNPAQDPDAIGCAVALGKTGQEVIDRLKEIEEAFKDCAVQLHIDPMADLLKEIEEAEQQGIEFTDKPMPEPAAVLDS